MKNDRCPICGRAVIDVALKMYGHCLMCEDKLRKNYKLEWQFDGAEERFKRLAFFRKIRGKAIGEWMKQQS